MEACVDRGLSRGELPGGLKVKRRAKRSVTSSNASAARTGSAARVDGLAYVYAMAVNEENAAGGKVVTAPTNGAAGVCRP